VCEATCKHELCSRAQDAHIAAGRELSGGASCMFDDCGFNYTACMDTNFLHVQFFDLFNEDLQPYGLQARCRARANEPARADGLFAYLEDIVGVPGASGALGDVEDVVGYCLGLQGNAETEATQTSGSSATGEPGEGVDST